MTVGPGVCIYIFSALQVFHAYAVLNLIGKPLINCSYLAIKSNVLLNGTIYVFFVIITSEIKIQSLHILKKSHVNSYRVINWSSWLWSKITHVAHRWRGITTWRMANRSRAGGWSISSVSSLRCSIPARGRAITPRGCSISTTRRRSETAGRGSESSTGVTGGATRGRGVCSPGWWGICTKSAALGWGILTSFFWGSVAAGRLQNVSQI